MKAGIHSFVLAIALFLLSGCGGSQTGVTAKCDGCHRDVAASRMCEKCHLCSRCDKCTSTCAGCNKEFRTMEMCGHCHKMCLACDKCGQ